MHDAVELVHLSKTYGGLRAVDDLSLQIKEGEFFSILGPSGCGKTTTLRLIAGFETPTSGEIYLHGQPISGVPAFQRPINTVFQNYALFPHMTVAQNVAFGLEMQRLPRKEIDHRVREALEQVRMADRANSRPHQLSGGQQQRVALARALAPDPQVILLDEPFSNLDAVLRKATREEMRRILRQSGATAVFVTHDQEEAFSIADIVAVMREGVIEQIGAPHEIYLRPATRAVATFVGDANFVPARASGRCAECVLGRVPLVTPRDGAVEVMVRPEALDLCPDAAGCGLIEEIVFFGHDQLIGIRMCDGTLIQARTGPRVDIAPGARVTVRVQGEAVAFPCAENRELRTEN